MKKLEKHEMKTVTGGTILACVNACNAALKTCLSTSPVSGLAKCFTDYGDCSKNCVA